VCLKPMALHRECECFYSTIFFKIGNLFFSRACSVRLAFVIALGRASKGMDPMYHPSTHIRVRGRRPAADNDDQPTAVPIAEGRATCLSDGAIADRHGGFLVALGLGLVFVVVVLSGLVVSATL
jgi:hypothetical protein